MCMYVVHVCRVMMCMCVVHVQGSDVQGSDVHVCGTCAGQ